MQTIILDTETHGRKGRVIELAWLNPSTGETFLQRYNPECKIEPSAMDVHHIIDNDLIDMPSYLTATIPPDTQFIVGHNIAFDVSVLNRSGIKTDHIKQICTVALAMQAWSNIGGYGLGSLIYALNEDQAVARQMRKTAHSALGDVKMTAWLYDKIIEKLGVGDDPMVLHTLSEEARIPTKIKFGKHKGKLIKDLPADYVQWLLNLTDLNPYLRTALLNMAAPNA